MKTTHIAILKQPFLNMILNGEKTIESRWSNNKIAPYQKITSGETILLKETGKDVIASAVAGKVEFYELTPLVAEEIRVKYGKEIGIDKFTNWNEVSQKKYLTLIWLTNVRSIPPTKVKRSNGAGWLVLNSTK